MLRLMFLRQGSARLFGNARCGDRGRSAATTAGYAWKQSAAPAGSRRGAAPAVARGAAGLACVVAAGALPVCRRR
eukprot:6210972-Pleurochrysis_carterae.AAC.6